jgi:hypothetical protein
LSGEFDQNSWFSLAEDAWVSYHINIVNKTTDEVENQFMILSLIYPKRNFTLNGSYFITESQLNSEAKLIWDSHQTTPKIVGASFDWRNSSSKQNIANQTAELKIKHPSFKKDVEFIGTLARRDIHDLMNVGLTVDYSTNKNKLLILKAFLRDESNLPIERKYSYSITGQHVKTNLNMNVNGYFKKHKAILVETINSANYKRSFLPEEKGNLLGRVDLNKNEVEFSRVSNEQVKYLQARYYANYPEYIINGSIIDSRELNATGAFFINLQEKLTWMMVNYTPGMRY